MDDKLIENIIAKKKNQTDFITDSNKKDFDKRAIRTNFVRGTETIDSNGVLYSEWTGMFYDITKRKMTDEEFMAFCDWADNPNNRKEVDETILDFWKRCLESIGVLK